MTHEVTVHDFLAVGSISTAKIALRLERARDLALAYSDGHRWVTPLSTIDTSVFTLRPDRLCQYHIDPPPVTIARKSITIPDWGVPSRADDRDHLRLHDLEEFESTNFQPCLARRKMRSIGSSRDGKRPQENGSNMNEPAKRPRLENSSVLDLIPQPHFVPAPAAIFQPVDTTKIPHYQKTSPSPVAPYDMATVNELLSGNFRRGAWLIPVRGSLPWDVSTAVILDDTQVISRSPSPCLPVSVAQPRAITWTPNVLLHFWTFLGSIQQARHLGPLSLSFHATSVDALSIRDTASEPVSENNQLCYPQRSLESAAGFPDGFAADICQAQLGAMDYIKVYHDVPYSLSLRNILDAYRYELVDVEVAGRSGANDRKIRILKGARLVFMDELSKAIFLM